ncbi:SlyX family protein [Aliidiomarina sanyensis]|uniref:Protein SlyX homolog n=1 Tax=Aliidiomarina sanyensis TaxID=1249555 RepID=A0A432WKD7_9GAMM|nr:SlyX family protein [Aliidiomarina sanyensis]RUO34159.1 SlyX protein [Aliidiomarina sanyensis]
MSKNSPNVAAPDAALIERIDRLETQLAFQEDTIAELNELLTQQNQELAKLHKHFFLVLERVQQLNDSQKEAPVDERPPHY